MAAHRPYGLHAATVAKHLGVGVQAVLPVLEDLASRGLVLMGTQGHYRCPPVE